MLIKGALVYIFLQIWYLMKFYHICFYDLAIVYPMLPFNMLENIRLGIQFI